MVEKLPYPLLTPPSSSLVKLVSPIPLSPMMIDDQVIIVIQKLYMDIIASIPISFEPKHIDILSIIDELATKKIIFTSLAHSPKLS